MKVRSFKLTTGEELVAQLVEETSMGYKIKSPLVIHMMRNPDGVSLGFAEYSMIIADQVIELFNHGLITVPMEVRNDVEQSYITNVTGIVLAPATPSVILQG